MKTTTDQLVSMLNATRGKKYPESGYIIFSDIRGDGRNIKSLWVYLPGGGVAYSEMNGKNPRERCAKLRAAIAAHEESQE